MRRHLAWSVIAGLFATTVVATTPANASFSVIRWEGTRFCQIWDAAIPGQPIPGDFRVVAMRLPSFEAALAAKSRNMQAWGCWW